MRDLNILVGSLISAEARVGVPFARASRAGCFLIYPSIIHLRKVAT